MAELDLAALAAEIFVGTSDMVAKSNAWADFQTMFVSGKIDDPDSFDAEGGKTGALGYYPLASPGGPTVYRPCIARIVAFAAGSADPEELEALLAASVAGAAEQVGLAVGAATAAAVAREAASASAASVHEVVQPTIGAPALHSLGDGGGGVTIDFGGAGQDLIGPYGMLGFGKEKVTLTGRSASGADFPIDFTPETDGSLTIGIAGAAINIGGTPGAATIGGLRVTRSDSGIAFADSEGAVVFEILFSGISDLNGFVFNSANSTITAPNGSIIFKPSTAVSDPLPTELPAWSPLDNLKARAIMDAHWEAPTQWRRRFIYNAVTALEASGALDAIIGPLYFTEADNEQAAKLDWKNPGRPFDPVATFDAGNPYVPPAGATHVKDRGFFDASGVKIAVAPNLSALTTPQLESYNAVRTEWLKNVGAWRPTSHPVSPEPKIIRAGTADAARFSRTATPLIPDLTVCCRRTLFANYGVPLDFRERLADGTIVHHPVGAHGEGADSYFRVQVSDDDLQTFDFGAAIVLRSPDNVLADSSRLGIIDCHSGKLANGKALLFAPASTSRRSIWIACVENPLAAPRDWKIAGLCWGDFGFVGKGRVQPSGRFLYTANDVLPAGFDSTGNPLYADYGAKVCELVEYDGQLRSNRVAVLPPPPDYTKNEFAEASIIEWADGHMFATFRAGDGQYSTSRPAGGAWTTPVKIAGTIDSRADCSLTPDGRLMFVFNASTLGREKFTLRLTPIGARDLSVIESEALIDPRGRPDPTISYIGIDYKFADGEWWVEGSYDRGRGRRPLEGTAAADAELVSDIHFFRVSLASLVAKRPVVRRTVQRG